MTDEATSSADLVRVVAGTSDDDQFLWVMQLKVTDEATSSAELVRVVAGTSDDDQFPWVMQLKVTDEATSTTMSVMWLVEEVASSAPAEPPRNDEAA